MALLNDADDLGGRRSLIDPARWSPGAADRPAPRKPRTRAAAPEPARSMAAPQASRDHDLTAGAQRPAPATQVAASNIDTSLRDRIPMDRVQRLAAQRDELLRRHGLPPEPATPDAAYRQEPQRALAPRDPEPEPMQPVVHNPRQSARPVGTADAERTRMPAPRRATEPDPFAARVAEVRPHGSDVLDELEDLRREVSELRREMKAMQQAGAGGGIGPVERAVQRLAERMDRLDGGAQPAISDGRGGRRRTGGGGLFGLFRPRR